MLDVVTYIIAPTAMASGTSWKRGGKTAQVSMPGSLCETVSPTKDIQGRLKPWQYQWAC